MIRKNSRFGIVLFVIGVILAGACNAFARVFTVLNRGYVDSGGTELPFYSTLLFVINIALYLFLIIYWILSVYQRILPSRARSYIIWAAVFMLYFVMYHAVKYRVFEVSQYPVMRFLWYSFYVPLIFISTLFLMMSIRILKNDDKSGFDERLLLIPAVILSALIMTNTLNHFAFIPVNGYELCGIPQTYKYGFLYYLIYAYAIIMTIIGLVFLTKTNGKSRNPLRIATPFLLFLLIPLMFFANISLTLLNAPQPFLFPDMVILYVIALFESCIRGRLISYNEDYAGLFGKMTLPAVITDRSYNRVYETAEKINAVPDELQNSLSGAVYPEPDIRLSGKKLRTANVFWTEDETELRKSEFKLREANEIIASENELIRAENQVREEKARVDFHNRSFEKIAKHIAPAQNRAIELSEKLNSKSDSFHAEAARILVIDSYIKRCINMMLLSDGKELIKTAELVRSFNESALYLEFCDVRMTAINRSGDYINSIIAIAFYDTFEMIAESLIGIASEIEITFTQDTMEIFTDCASLPDFGYVPLPINIKKSDNGFVLTVTAEEGGEL